MGANDRASSTLVRMEGKENRSPIAKLVLWMAIEVSDHSKLICPTMWEIGSTPNFALFLMN